MAHSSWPPVDAWAYRYSTAAGRSATTANPAKHYLRLGEHLGINPKITGWLSAGGATAGMLVQQAALAVSAGMAEVVAVVFGDAARTGGSRFSAPSGAAVSSSNWGMYGNAANSARTSGCGPATRRSSEKAKELFREKFQDPNRYRLGQGRPLPHQSQVRAGDPRGRDDAAALDYLNAIRYIIKLRDPESKAQIDDIDHLGNRRVRTIDELAADELRKGFLKLRRTVQERMSMRDQQDMTPRTLINPKSISAAIEYFFGRGELSQVVDQTNPLSQLTHERRLSALGPGGLNRKRAGFDVRDVHISHYGRICPIETPEGTNIGLISHLSIYAGVDEYGFLVTPYRTIAQGQAHRRGSPTARRRGDACATWLPPTRPSDGVQGHRGPHHRPHGRRVRAGGIGPCPVHGHQPKQMVGVSAGLIPFLEHDDANRALMGSNMQRQAVPLLVTEPPIVSTGLEKAVAMNSGMVVRAERAGTVTYVDAHAHQAWTSASTCCASSPASTSTPA